MTFEDAKLFCHVRSAIYRKSKPSIKYNKNHDVPFEDRVPPEDQKASDWAEYDPSEEYPPYYGLA